MLEEHETARTLVSALRRALERLESGVAAAEQEVVSQGQDLVLLLRDHIRKEERVLFPLLRRFQEETCE
jgi:hemerythrin-like domain-containing protein